MDIGSAVGRQQGLSPEKILGLAEYMKHPDFSRQERLALQLADAMTLSPAARNASGQSSTQQRTIDVPEALFIELRDTFGLEATIELSAAIAWENFRSRFNRCFEVASDGFSEHGMCALPVVSPSSSVLS